MFGAFRGGGLAPVNAALVIIKQGCHVLGVLETEVVGAMAEGQCIFCAFVGRVDLSLAGGTTSSFLSLGFPEDRAATARDDVTVHGAE